MSRLSQQQQQMLPPASPEMSDSGLVIKVLMVNGDSRSLRIYKWYTVTDILKDILPRLRVNMEVALDWFGIQFRNAVTKECYWLQPGYPILQLVHEYSSASSVAEWQFLLLIRILPKTPQHISDVDPVSFQYFFDQILHQYLSDDSIIVDNEVGVKLGCLELRRFFKDMPHAALKKKENFTMLEKEIGLEKFFKRSLLQTVRKKPLRNLVLAAFKDYELITTEGCMFQFFNLLSKIHRIDEDYFVNCAVGLNPSLPFNSVIFVGPNCNIEYQDHMKERRFLAAFVDIQGISYESEMMERGKIILELRNNPAVVVHTAHLMTAIDMASLVDSYCIVYTENHHSRLTGLKRFSYSNMSEGVYNTIDELRSQQAGHPLAGTRPLSYSAFRSSSGTEEYSSVPGSEYSGYYNRGDVLTNRAGIYVNLIKLPDTGSYISGQILLPPRLFLRSIPAHPFVRIVHACSLPTSRVAVVWDCLRSTIFACIKHN